MTKYKYDMCWWCRAIFKANSAKQRSGLGMGLGSGLEFGLDLGFGLGFRAWRLAPTEAEYNYSCYGWWLVDGLQPIFIGCDETKNKNVWFRFLPTRLLVWETACELCFYPEPRRGIPGKAKQGKARQGKCPPYLRRDWTGKAKHTPKIFKWAYMFYVDAIQNYA